MVQTSHLAAPATVEQRRMLQDDISVATETCKVMGLALGLLTQPLAHHVEAAYRLGMSRESAVPVTWWPHGDDTGSLRGSP